MLIISGKAHYIKNDQESFTNGALHGFTMFSINEDFEGNLTNIEAFLINNGWDNISVDEVEIIADSSALEHPVLIEAFTKAEQQENALVIHNEPLASVA
jgi:hypothetical protein